METANSSHILLAEDNESFGIMLTRFLELNNLKVTWAKNGKEALELLQEEHFDLYIFDVMMPELDGFSLAENSRKLLSDKPLVFLAAKGLKEDQIQGYKLGATDYLVKPFDPDILLLKVNALLKQRVKKDEDIVQSISIGSFTYNLQERSLTTENFKKTLSPKEGELLLLLHENQNNLLKREDALLKIWKDDNYFTTQSMNVFITKLRNYLKNDLHHHIEVENIRGSGYILRVNQY